VYAENFKRRRTAGGGKKKIEKPLRTKRKIASWVEGVDTGWRAKALGLIGDRPQVEDPSKGPADNTQAGMTKQQKSKSNMAMPGEGNLLSRDPSRSTNDFTQGEVSQTSGEKQKQRRNAPVKLFRPGEYPGEPVQTRGAVSGNCATAALVFVEGRDTRSERTDWSAKGGRAKPVQTPGHVNRQPGGGVEFGRREEPRNELNFKTMRARWPQI